MDQMIETTNGTSSENKNPTQKYARAIASSKRARWEIDDVLRGRRFDASHSLMPGGLSLVERLPFLDEDAKIFFSRVQGRTYANMFGLIERWVNAKVLEVGQRHLFGDQIALEAMVRFSDEELKHQELFRRVEALAARHMPAGYRFTHDANAIASVVLGKSTWAVLALMCVVELVTQVHYKESIEIEGNLSPLFKDIFRAHWMEESQHAVLDILEWQAEDRTLDVEERDEGVTDLIALVGAVDSLVVAQASDDASYFLALEGSAFDAAQNEAVRATFAAAYRWQYIVSGVMRTQFPEMLRAMVTDAQMGRVEGALGPLLSNCPSDR